MNTAAGCDKIYERCFYSRKSSQPLHLQASCHWIFCFVCKENACDV